MAPDATERRAVSVVLVRRLVPRLGEYRFAMLGIGAAVFGYFAADDASVHFPGAAFPTSAALLPLAFALLLRQRVLVGASEQPA